MKITIIGLGLIGGSMARAFSRHGHTVLALDKNENSIKKAVADGVITLGSDIWQTEMESSDVVFIAAPAMAATQWLKTIAPKVQKNCVISDVCSTKGEIARIAEEMEQPFCFVGAHPMSGSEKSGYDAASEDLFENTYFIITPTKKSTPEGIERIEQLAKELNAIPLTTGADDHDRAVAAVSHLPHILAATLMNLVTDTDEKYLRLAAGGFRDMTRIAASDPVMWRDIVFSNKEKIVEMIDKLSDSLQSFKTLAKQNDMSAIEEFFAKSKLGRDRLPQKAAALTKHTYECVLSIPDRVGVIAEIAQKLGDAGINIKNLYVANSREHFGGVLVISFATAREKEEAEKLLKNECEMEGTRE